MTPTIEDKTVSTSEMTGDWSQVYVSGWHNLGNFWSNLLFSSNSTALWNVYARGLIEVQETVQKFNESLLQAYGFPTRSDNSRMSRQLYEVYNRLDELETRLNEHIAVHTSATPKA